MSSLVLLQTLAFVLLFPDSIFYHLKVMSSLIVSCPYLGFQIRVSSLVACKLLEDRELSNSSFGSCAVDDSRGLTDATGEADGHMGPRFQAPALNHAWPKGSMKAHFYGVLTMYQGG